MDFPDEPLSIVEEWKNKSYELSRQSNDKIASLLSNGIQSMAVVVDKESSKESVERVLKTLERERSLCMIFDENKGDVVRSLVYAHIESLLFILRELIKERNQMKESVGMFTQTEEESSHSFTEPLNSSNDALSLCNTSKDGQQNISNSFELSKEPFEDNSMTIENEDELGMKNEEMTHDVVDTELFDANVESDRDELRDVSNEERDHSENGREVDLGMKNEEMINDVVDTQMFDADTESDRDVVRDASNEGKDQSETAFENDDDLSKNDSNVDKMMRQQGVKEEISKSAVQNPKDSSKDVEVDKKRRSSRMIAKPMKYTESSDECDNDLSWNGDSEPTMKKPKIESTKMEKKRSSRTRDTVDKSSEKLPPKRNATDLECTECEFRTTSCKSFENHLRLKHLTTVALAGLAFRCDCGYEVVSYRHSLSCKIANFTLIRKREGPIRTFKEEKSTPQCVVCEKYPATACGYVHHLKNHHQSTLRSKGIYLLCSCGLKYTSEYPTSKHTAECFPREFTLHKLDDM